MSSTSLYITYLGKEGPFLKIWGQLDKNLPIAIDKALQDSTLDFNSGHHIPPTLHFYELGCLCCAKFSDEAYYRARITNVDSLRRGFVEVLFIDYGNTDLVQCKNIRTMAPFSKEFIEILPQAREFYLMDITHTGNAWDPLVLEQIMQIIRYVDVEVVNVIQIGPHYLIKLVQNEQDISSMLKTAGYGISVPNHIQQMLIQKNIMAKMHENQMMQPRFPVPPPPLPQTSPTTNNHQHPHSSPHQPSALSPSLNRPTILTYKSTPLEPGSEHKIYVSYVTDGPLLFSVQLKRTEETLRGLMNDLNTTTALQRFGEDPAPGAMCLAQSAEDGYICRAVVTNMVDREYKLYFVDFGNTEMRSIEYIYEIPHKFIVHKLMATRFALDGLDKAVITVQMKVAFKEFVENRLLNMKVNSQCIKTALPLGDIWDDKGIHAIDVVKQAAFEAYPDPISVAKGTAHPIRVTSVYSCNRFYIQLKPKDNEYKMVVDYMQRTCVTRGNLAASDVVPGRPCAAIRSSDKLWHRVVIKEVHKDTVNISFIDLGSEETTSPRNLKQAQYEQITSLRPHAIQCSLNGYQNMPPDVERDAFLTQILLNQEFTMKVIDIHGAVVICDIIDAKSYNVASLLLEKLANSRSQISPLLIQDSDKIEFRKRSPQPLYERKTYSRDQNSSFKPRESNDNRFDRQRNRDEGFMNRNRDDGFNRNKDDGFMSRNRNDSFDKNKENGLGLRAGNREGFQQKKHHRNASGTDSGSEKDTTPDRGNNFGRYNKPNDKVNNYGDANANKGYSRADSRDGAITKGKPSYNANKVSSKASDSGSDAFDDSSKRDFKPKFERKERRDNNPRADGDRMDYAKKNQSDYQSRPAEENLVLASAEAQYQMQMLVGTAKSVGICWFHNPGSFFVQLEDAKIDLQAFMKTLQSTYKQRRTITAIVNQSVVAQYPADNAFYRATVLDVGTGKYRVKYVDFGNISGTSKVLAIEEQHMTMPMQALHCQLAGIKPIDKEWPNANLLRKHFDVDVFNCEFVGVTEDKFEVILTHNGKSVADQLVADELAAAIVTLDLPMLYCQEIKVLLNSVNSLSDFVVEVEPNVKVQCSLHNLSSAAETFEATLKELVGYFVIAFFDNIADNKAEVTLYDTAGQKLPLLQPDEDALASISPLCNMPVLTSTIQGFVAHATASSIFVQPSKYTPYVEQMLEDMFNAYNGVEVTEPVVPEVGYEYGVLSVDQNWYRAKVISIDDANATTTVHYIDYGNDETVNVTNVRLLEAAMYDTHELCAEIRMERNNETLIDTDVTVDVAYADDGWTAVEKVPKAAQPSAAKVVQAEVPMVKAVVAEAVREKVVEEIGQEEVATYDPYGIPVVVSHIDSPGQFYVQLANDLEAIDALQAHLLAQIETLADAEAATVGMLCAALYSSNHEWYRAEVLAVDGGNVSVRFVDYGNSEMVDSAQAKVKILPADLQSLERYARPCSLYITPIHDKWSTEAIARFEGLSYVDDVCAEILDQTEDLTYIHLYINDTNLAEVLVNENHALKMGDEAVVQTETIATTLPTLPDPPAQQPQSSSPEVGIPVIVSHIDSPGQFYVQLSSDLDTIESLQANLQTEVAALADVEAATPGVLCAAIYSGNQEWYRAQVLDSDVDITTVRFVDYGNTDVLDNKQTKVKTLSSELLTLEQYARRCSLYVTSTIESSDWSQEACARFEELAYADGAVRAEIIEQDDKTTYVNLFVGNVNVGDVLVAEKHGAAMHFETEATYPTGFISHVNSPSEFWIQLENACSDLERIADQLEKGASTFEKLNDMSPGTLCAAVFPDDDNWYRARILSNTVAGIEVLFIDYGNSCTCTNLRELPEDLVMTTALAQKCCLQKPDGVLQWSPAATETFKEIAADGRTIFIVHNLVPGETTIVQLYHEDVDISTHLLPITFEGFISHYENLDSFWIRQTSDEATLQKVTDLLVNAKDWPKTDEVSDIIIAAYIDADNMWHRANVIDKVEGKEEYNVILADYGASARTNDIRVWSAENSEEFAPLAKQCKLLPLPGFKFTAESESQFKTLHKNGETVFHVEFISDDTVQLYYEMQDVRGSLDSVKSTPIPSVQVTPTKIVDTTIRKYVEELEEILKVQTLNELADEMPSHDAEVVESNVEQDKVTNEDIGQIVDEAVEQIPLTSPEKIIEKCADITAEPAARKDSDIQVVEDITNEIVENSMQSPKKIIAAETPSDNASELTAIVNDFVEASVKSSLKQSEVETETIAQEFDDKSVSALDTPSDVTTIMDEIVDESVHSSVKQTDVSAIIDELIDQSATRSEKHADVTTIVEEIVNDSVNSSVKQSDVTSIVDELINETVKSPVKQRTESTHIKEIIADIVELTLKDSVTPSAEIFEMNENIAKAAVNVPNVGSKTSEISPSDKTVGDIIGDSQETVSNHNLSVKEQDKELPIVNNLLSELSAAEANLSENRLIESNNDNVEINSKTVSADIINSIVDGLQDEAQ